MAFPFSCRTLAPWEEDRWGFTNAAGLKVWLQEITGDTVSYDRLCDVRAWLQGANKGDVAYLNDVFKLVPCEEGEIEIRCNRPVVV